jgi:predicted acylesterase/phospholipase RssA
MISRSEKFAVILTGGGARGSFQAGVLNALMRSEIPIGLVIGTSIGALNALSFCTGVNPIWLWCKPLNSDKSLFKLKWFDFVRTTLKGGLYIALRIALFLIEISLLPLLLWGDTYYAPMLTRVIPYNVALQVAMKILIVFLMAIMWMLAFRLTAHSKELAADWINRDLPKSVDALFDLSPLSELAIPEVIITLKAKLLGRSFFGSSVVKRFRKAQIGLLMSWLLGRVESMLGIHAQLEIFYYHELLPILRSIREDIGLVFSIFRLRGRSRDPWEIFEMRENRIKSIVGPVEQIPELLRNKLDASEHDLTNLIITALNIKTGKLHAFHICDEELRRFLEVHQPLSGNGVVWHEISSDQMLVDSLIASSSIPGIFPATKVTGVEQATFVDGGLDYGVLLRLAEELGYNKIIIVPTQSVSKNSEVASRQEGLAHILLRSLNTLIYNMLRNEIKRVQNEPGLECYLLEPKYHTVGELLDFTMESSAVGIAMGKISACKFFSTSKGLAEYHHTPCYCHEAGDAFDSIRTMPNEYEEILTGFVGWHRAQRVGLFVWSESNRTSIFVTTKRICIVRFRDVVLKHTGGTRLSPFEDFSVQRGDVVGIETQGIYKLCLLCKNGKITLRVEDAPEAASIIRESWQL